MRKLFWVLVSSAIVATAMAQSLPSASTESFNQQDAEQMKQRYNTTLSWMEEHCDQKLTSKYAKCGYLPTGSGCRAQAYQNCKAAISPTKVDLKLQQQ
jgi:Ni/Co efflux regulator RcnB